MRYIKIFTTNDNVETIRKETTITNGRINFDNDKTYEMVILNFPLINTYNKKMSLNKKSKEKYISTLHSHFNSSATDTEKCITILVNEFKVNEHYIRNEKGNIYCPLHENKQKSKTPSGKLFVKSNIYTCFSTNCTLHDNKNGNKVISTTSLLKHLNAKKMQTTLG